MKVIAGSANNQLKEKRHGDKSMKWVLFMHQTTLSTQAVLLMLQMNLMVITVNVHLKRVEGIYDIIGKIFEISKRDNIPTYVAADRLAEERIARVAKSRSQFLTK